MTPTRALRQEELLSECVVSPDVFNHMADRLGDCMVPYQEALETEAGKCNVPLYLEGLLSHLPRKNAEEIVAAEDYAWYLGVSPARWRWRPRGGSIPPRRNRRHCCARPASACTNSAECGYCVCISWD